MVVSTRKRWLDVGLDLLAESGLDGVRIDRIAGRLGLSKGSFYHHFAGISGYRLALLDHFAERYTTRYIALVDAEPDRSARDRIGTLIEVVTAGDRGDDLESAVRAWAARDDDARATLAQIDQTRMDYLAQLLAELDPDTSDPWLSRALYLTLVGSRHVLPPMSLSELKPIFDRLVDLAAPPSARDVRDVRDARGVVDGRTT